MTHSHLLARWKIVVLIVLAGGMATAFGAMITLDHFTRQAPVYLMYFAVAFTLYLAAAALLWQVEIAANRHLLAAVFVAALLMRAPLWFTEPTLSTDIWRYLWDGRLLTRGVNPYAERVDSPTLDPLATPLRAQVQHQWMASPYPPVAQVVFGGIYGLVPESPTAMQVAFTLFDLTSGAIVVALLTRLKRPTGRVLLYLWNPLVIVEFAHSAHVDSLMTLLVLLAVWFTLDRRQSASMAALALATLTKFVPGLLLPVFVRRWGWRRTLGYGGVVMLGFVPFLGAGLGLSAKLNGTGILGAVRIYTFSWKTNDGLFYWLVKGLEGIGIGQPVNVAKLIGLVILAGMGLWVWGQMTRSFVVSKTRALSKTSNENLSDDAVVTGVVLQINAYLLLTATMFPWYIVWLIALLPLLPVEYSQAWWMIIAGWVIFSAAVNLSYLFYLDPVNPHEIEWVRRVEYWPLFVLLLVGALWSLWDGRRGVIPPAGR